MVVETKSGPRRITNPTVQRRLNRAVEKALNEHERCKGDIRALLYRYYRFYPRGFVDGVDWTRSVLSEEDIESFFAQGIIVRSHDGTQVKLGPGGLTLISMWNTERLTKWVIALTIITILVGVASICVALL